MEFTYPIVDQPLPSQSTEDATKVALDQYNAFIKAQREYCLTDFWEFCTVVLGYKNLQPFHKDLCEFVQGKRKYKRMILLPRGHLKSTMITVGYSLWRMAQEPSVRILIANATAPMADAFLRQIKSHLKKNDKFIELYGDLSAGAEKWSDSAIRLKMIRATDPKENSVTAFGIGGNLVSQHYDIMIFDDLVNRENIHTPERIADVLTFYQDAQDLVDDPLKTEQIMIGTRWHEADLYGTISDPSNPEFEDWRFMKREAVEGDYQIVKNPSTGRFEIEGGRILYDLKYPREALNKLISSKGLSNFSAQYLNNPIPKGQSIFKYDFKPYEETDVRGWEFNTFITIDPTFYDPRTMRSKRLDYCGVVVNKVNYMNDWYIVDLINERFSPSELIELMFELDSKYKPKTIGIEATNWQRILGYQAREKMREKNHFLPITELKHSGVLAKSKTDRIQGLEPRYASGSIYHNPNARHIVTLEDQLRRFPKSKHDDLMDALASQLEVAFPPRRRQMREDEDEKKSMISYPA